jgi:hypothetical protein
MKKIAASVQMKLRQDKSVGIPSSCLASVLLRAKEKRRVASDTVQHACDRKERELMREFRFRDF